MRHLPLIGLSVLGTAIATPAAAGEADTPEARLRRQEQQLDELARRLGQVRLSVAREGAGGTGMASLLDGLSINGSVSQGFAWCDADHRYLTLDTARGTFALTDMTLAVRKRLSPRLGAGIQIYNRSFGEVGQHRFELDYAYLDYGWREWLGVRAGRVKSRYGLYNDIQDQDALHPWVFSPYGVYDPSNRGLQLNHDGFDLYGDLGLGAAGTLRYAGYGGAAQVLAHERLQLDMTRDGLEVADSDVHYLAGGDLQYVGDGVLAGLRLGASYMWTEFSQRMRGYQPLPLFATPPVVPQLLTPYELVNETTEPLKTTVFYAEYEWEDLRLAAEWEYVDTHLKLTWSYPGLPPLARLAEEKSVGYYGLVSWRWSRLGLDWLQTAVYFSSFLESRRRGFTHPENYLRDWAFTIRLDVTPNWYWKIEAHDLHGWQPVGGGAGSPFSGNEPNRSEHWFMLAVKTGVVF